MVFGFVSELIGDEQWCQRSLVDVRTLTALEPQSCQQGAAQASQLAQSLLVLIQ